MKKTILSISMAIIIVAGFSQTTYWYNYTSGNQISAIIEDGNTLWIGTSGGLVKKDLLTDENIYYNATNSGLPENTIPCMELAPDGKLWMGTGSRGMVCFEGDTWTVFSTENSAISGNAVGVIKIDQEGTVWLTGGEYDNYMGLVKFNGNSFTNYTTLSSNIPTNHILELSLDNEGNIYLGTAGKGLTVFTGSEWIKYNSGNSGLPGDYVHAVLHDQNNTLWLGYSEGSDQGLASFDGNNWQIFDHNNSPMPFDPAYSLSIDQQGALWCACNPLNEFGLIRFDGTNWTLFNTSNSPIPSDYISTISSTSEGSIWFGTSKGLVAYNQIDFEIHNTSNSGIPYDNRLNSMAVDENNKVWIGGNDGLLAFDGEDWQVFNMENSSLENNSVSSPVFDSEELLWLRSGYPSQLTSFDGNDFTFHDPPSYVYGTISGPICIDKQDKKFFKSNGQYLTSDGLVSLMGNSWHKYDSASTGVDFATLSRYAIDTNNTLWVGVYDYLVSYDIPYWNGHIIPNMGGAGLSALRFDNNNVLWGSIWDEGLFRKEGEDWEIYTKDNSGLPDNYINDIQFDTAGKVWLATNGGLVKFDGAEWIVYDESNSGLPCNIVNYICIDQNNNKWITCKNSGLTLFNEEGLWTSGLEEKVSNNKLFVFPNPVSNYLHLQIPEEIRTGHVSIYFPDGREIYTTNTLQDIDVRFLRRGVYLIIFRNELVNMTSLFIRK